MNKVLWYRLAFRILPALPRVPVQVLAEGIALIVYACAGSTRRQVRANLARIPALAADPERRERAVRQVFRQLLLNYIDLFAPPPLDDAATREAFPVEGEELVAQLRQSGKGVVFIGAHFAPFEWAMHRLSLIVNDHVVAPLENIQPPELFDLVITHRLRTGLDLQPVESTDTLKAMITALRRNECVMLLIDRDVQHNGTWMPFFGVPARLPTGIIALLRLTGAEVIWMEQYRTGRGTARGVFRHLPISVSRSTRSDDEIRAAFVPFLRAMEESVARHPDQWLASFSSEIWPPVPVAESEQVVVSS